jgi:hypothetical protein
MNPKPDNDNSTAAAPSRRLWLWLPALAVILVLVLLIAIPYGMSWALKDWLLENGAGQVEINDVDFNPFTGITTVKLLNVSVDDRDTLVIPGLTLDLDWSPFLDRRIHVNAITIDGVNVLVEQDADGNITVGGIAIEDSGSEETPGDPWDYGVIELGIRNTVIDYRAPDLQLKTEIDDLALTELATWTDRPAPLAVTGKLNGAGFEIDGALPPLEKGYGYSGRVKLTGLPLETFAALAQPAVESLASRASLDTHLELALAPDQPFSLRHEGMVRLDDLSLTLPEEQLDLQHGVARWDGTVAYTATDTGELEVNGKLHLETTRVGVANSNIQLASRASLDTHLELALAPDQPFSLRHEGMVRLDDLSLTLPEEQLDLQQGVARWDGTAAYTATDTAELEVNGKLHLEKTRVGVADSNVQLASFEVLDAEDISVQGVDAIKTGSVSIDTAVFAETLGETDEPGVTAGEPPPLKIASLVFENIEFTDGKRVSIDSILSDKATYVAQRNKGGKWRMATILGSLPFADREEDKPEAAGQQAPDAEATSFRIGVIKNTNATLTLEDTSVSPAFKTRFNLEEVTRDIDSAKPDQDTHIYLKGNIAKHNKVEIKGTIRPFAEALSMNLETHIEGLEMPPFSPYAIDAIGHRLDSGQLDADSSMVIDKGKLDGSNNLTLRSLVLSPVESKSLDKMNSQLAVPLNKALDMLRDNHDVIQLKLPITGDLDSPNFDASDAINQAVAKATKEGAITSLTLLLQPYGSLITVARYAAEKAAEIKLEPVVFSPATADIDAARHDYLDKVAGIVKQRPNVNVRLCGVATAADRTALQEQALAAVDDKKKKAAAQETPAIDDAQLIDLADRRDAAIKDYFIEKHGVKAGRLVACKPAIDAAEGAEPRVDLLI